MTLKQKLYELKKQRAVLLGEAESAIIEGKLDENTAKMTEISKLNDQIAATEKTIEEQSRFGAEDDSGAGAPAISKSDDGKTSEQKAIKSFANAARTGFKAAGDAMQEGVPADGGYTVPEDITTRIYNLIESQDSLLGEVTNTPVKTKSGSRTYKKRKQHTGFATIAEGGKVTKAATPEFARIDYTITKKGGYLPVTDELLEDSDENIVDIISTWFADEARVTINKGILAVVATKSKKNLKDLDGIKDAWLKLGKGFRAISKVYTNTDGISYLSSLKDKNGRSLFDGEKMTINVDGHVLAIYELDNETMESEVSGTANNVPFIIGSLKEGVQRSDRKQLSITDSSEATVGNFNAFENDMHLFKGIMRDDYQLRDAEAFVYGYIDVNAAPTTSDDSDSEGGEG